MMKSTFIKIYIIPMMMLSPIMAISCNSLFSIWMSMELNLLSFIPFIIFMNKFNKELAMKYFIIQALSSAMFILSSVSSYTNLNFFYMYIEQFSLMINLSLLIKLGAAPFHSWFISMIKNMTWINCFILSTLQKIIPMIILMIFFCPKIMYLSALSSALMGSLLGLNHQSIRLIMGYSSINHISWMLINMMISEYTWMLYFISYSLINFNIMLTLNSMKIYYLNQILYLNQTTSFKIITILNFLSISGLPPMFGFIMKWTTITYMTWNSCNLMIMILMTLSILNFIFYTRICLIFLMNNYLMSKINLYKKFIINKIPILLSIWFTLLIWMINQWMT